MLAARNALLGLFAIAAPMALAGAPAARAAELPAFVNATICDAAAPISTGAPVFRRSVKAERVARPRSAPAAEQAEAEEEPALRPAVHYCVTPGGVRNPVRYT